MENLSEKFRAARDVLRLNQTDVERNTGVWQTDISMLENGKKKFVPTEYLVYLSLRGIDLNALFDNRITAEDFKKNPLDITETPCEEKDKMIAELKDHVKLLLSIIDTIKKATQ